MVRGDAAPLSAVAAGRDGGSDGVTWSHHRDAVQGTGGAAAFCFHHREDEQGWGQEETAAHPFPPRFREEE